MITKDDAYIIAAGLAVDLLAKFTVYEHYDRMGYPDPIDEQELKAWILTRLQEEMGFK